MIRYEMTGMCVREMYIDHANDLFLRKWRDGVGDGAAVGDVDVDDDDDRAEEEARCC